MWTWLTHTQTRSARASKTSKTRTTPPRRPGLALEWLESREVPAVVIQLDFTYDQPANGGTGFFSSHPDAKAVIERAAQDLGSHLDTHLAALAGSGANTWTATFYNPATGNQTSVGNVSVGADTLLVYVGARNIDGPEAGFGGYGGYAARGSSAWLNTLQTRDHAGFASWGGSVAFDTDADWFYGLDSTAGLSGNKVDFYSVATHELGHMLGIGTAPQWWNQVSGNTFVGPNAEAVFGGPVPISEDQAHPAHGLKSDGRALTMDPYLQTGTRSAQFTSLDSAILKDLGWSVRDTPTSPPPVTNPPVTVPPTVPPVTPPVTPPVGNGTPAGEPVVLTGPTDGSARGYTLAADGTLTANGFAVTPFPGFGGVVRSVAADFNGDGTDDYAFGTGAGTNARVRVIDGKSGADIAGPTFVLDGFTGGVFLAAADVDRDGRAELAVSADAGGGNRISLNRVENGTLTPAADFFAFGDARFRGGSRIALADVNGDGAADLIVGAGIGGGPRVAVYDGASVVAGSPRSLVPDFFALDPNLRNGVFVTAADLDGDGYAEVAYSTGTGGGPRVRIVSGRDIASNPGVDAYYLPAVADFFALNPEDRSGLRIAARDLNRDGKAELVVASGNSRNAQVRVITMDDLKATGTATSRVFNPFGDPTTLDGVYVG